MVSLSMFLPVLPEKMVALVERMRAGDGAGARAVHYQLLPVITALMGLDTNPIPIKGAMEMVGLIEANYRLPMTPLTERAREELQSVLNEYDPD